MVQEVTQSRDPLIKLRNTEVSTPLFRQAPVCNKNATKEEQGNHQIWEGRNSQAVQVHIRRFQLYFHGGQGFQATFIFYNTLI